MRTSHFQGQDLNPMRLQDEACSTQEIEQPQQECDTPQQVVSEQANDPALWRLLDITAPEAYLQQALRRLHTAVEESTKPLPVTGVLELVDHDDGGLWLRIKTEDYQGRKWPLGQRVRITIEGGSGGGYRKSWGSQEKVIDH